MCVSLKTLRNTSICNVTVNDSGVVTALSHFLPLTCLTCFSLVLLLIIKVKRTATANVSWFKSKLSRLCFDSKVDSKVALANTNASNNGTKKKSGRVRNHSRLPTHYLYSLYNLYNYIVLYVVDYIVSLSAK